jgi:hypothetical protein
VLKNWSSVMEKNGWKMLPTPRTECWHASKFYICIPACWPHHKECTCMFRSVHRWLILIPIFSIERKADFLSTRALAFLNLGNNRTMYFNIPWHYYYYFCCCHPYAGYFQLYYWNKPRF